VPANAESQVSSVVSLPGHGQMDNALTYMLNYLAWETPTE
jgi:hypothetical protein